MSRQVAVEGLRAGMVVLLPGDEYRPAEQVQLTSQAWGTPTGYRSGPRIAVHAYGTVVGSTGIEGARHLQWAGGTTVEVL